MKRGKKGQGFTQLLYGAAVIGVLVIFLSLLAVLNNSFRDAGAECRTDFTYNATGDICTNGTDRVQPSNLLYNITLDGDAGLQEMSSQTPTLMLVLAFAVILSLIIGIVAVVSKLNQ